MKKQLLTVGDSWTQGDELTDVYQAWPYRLAADISYQVNNQGSNGSSNTSILRRTLEELSTNKYDLVIVGWSLPGRIEWKDTAGPAYDVWPAMAAPWFKEPWRHDLVDFISEYHDPVYLYQLYLIGVLSLQSYCKVNNIKLLMIDVIQNNYYRIEARARYTNLEKQVNRENFVGWERFGMKELTHGLPHGPGLHPLEQGHQKIANKINEHIRNLGWLS